MYIDTLFIKEHVCFQDFSIYNSLVTYIEQYTLLHIFHPDSHDNLLHVDLVINTDLDRKGILW